MNLVLVDTSAWIEFFRDGQSPYGAVVDALLRESMVCISGLVKAEILPGAKSNREFKQLESLFNALPLLVDSDNMWENVITGQRKLKKKGINGVGIPDLLIGVVAISHDVRVFSKDRHFKQMEKHLGLKLFEVS